MSIAPMPSVQQQPTGETTAARGGGASPSGARSGLRVQLRSLPFEQQVGMLAPRSPVQRKGAAVEGQAGRAGPAEKGAVPGPQPQPATQIDTQPPGPQGDQQAVAGTQTDQQTVAGTQTDQQTVAGTQTDQQTVAGTQTEGPTATADDAQAPGQRQGDQQTAAGTQAEGTTATAVDAQAPQQEGEQETPRAPVAQAPGSERAEADTGGTGDARAAAPALLNAFVTQFNRVFQPVLHVFAGGVTAENAGRLFTPQQMRLLAAFDNGSTVPYGLFNGAGSTGQLSNSQRILIASHILLVGTFSPEALVGRRPAEESQGAQAAEEGGGGGAQEGGGGAQQAGGAQQDDGSGARQLGANSCRHWAMMVYAYSGLGVPGEGVEGVWHTVDPTGAIVLSAPGAPRRTGVGSAASAHVDEPGEAPCPDPTVFEPGDWLEIAWANGGGHSVVFQRLLANNERTFEIEYASQAINASRDRTSVRRRETKILGKRTGMGKPVVFGHTAMSGAGREATTVEQLLPGMTGETGGPNQRHMQRELRRVLRGQPLNEAHAMTWLCGVLRADNTALIARIEHRLGPDQLALLQSANVVEATAGGALEQLVRLNQRLRHLEENTRAVEDRAAEQVGQDASTPYNAGTTSQDALKGSMYRRGGQRVSAAQTRAYEQSRASGLLRDLPNGTVPWSSYSQPAEPAAS